MKKSSEESRWLFACAILLEYIYIYLKILQLRLACTKYIHIFDVEETHTIQAFVQDDRKEAIYICGYVQFVSESLIVHCSKNEFRECRKIINFSVVVFVKRLRKYYWFWMIMNYETVRSKLLNDKSES